MKSQRFHKEEAERERDHAAAALRMVRASSEAGDLPRAIENATNVRTHAGLAWCAALDCLALGASSMFAEEATQAASKAERSASEAVAHVASMVQTTGGRGRGNK